MSKKTAKTAKAKKVEAKVEETVEKVEETVEKVEETVEKIEEKVDETVEKVASKAKKAVRSAQKKVTAALVPEVYVQWDNMEISMTDIIEKAKEDFKAEHSDITPIGVIIDDGEKKYYITGDTLYNEEIFDDIPNDIYALFLPINGVGNNMNKADAARFAARVKHKCVVPVHFGMFDEIIPQGFNTVPKIYEEIKL